MVKTNITNKRLINYCHVVFLFCLLLSFFVTQLSCSNKSYFKGKIVDNDKNPVENVVIKLIEYKPRKVEDTAKLLQETKSNNKGEFKFTIPNIEPDRRFSIVFLKEGYTGRPVSFTNKQFDKHEDVFNDYLIVLKNIYNE